MKLKKTKVAAMAIAIVLLAGNVGENGVYAMELNKQIPMIVNSHEVTPLWDEISSISPYISADGTILYPEVYIYAKSSSGSISGTMYLEKYSSGNWTSVTSWKIKGTGNAFLSKSYNGTSDTKYRVRVAVTVDGENAEATSKSIQI